MHKQFSILNSKIYQTQDGRCSEHKQVCDEIINVPKGNNYRAKGFDGRLRVSWLNTNQSEGERELWLSQMVEYIIIFIKFKSRTFDDLQENGDQPLTIAVLV